MADGKPRRCYHQSAQCKRYVAAKVARLAAIDFLHAPPHQWTPEQRAAYEAWYPGDTAVAAEMIADPRFPRHLLD